MKPGSRKSALLVAPAFLIAVALLLLNDLILKRAFPGFITGKLSDFAGLFAFALFFLAVVPVAPRVMLLCLAAFFVFWKSPCSTPLLDGWNALHLLPLARAVDSTDLIALAILPFAYMTWDRAPASHVALWLRLASSAISLFAFAATTYMTEEQTAAYYARVAVFQFEPGEHWYHFAASRAQLYERLKQLGYSVSGGTRIFAHFPRIVSIDTGRGREVDTHPRSAWVLSCELAVEGTRDETNVSPMTIRIRRGPEEATRAEALRLFERGVIDPLAGEPATTRSPGTSDRVIDFGNR